MADNDFISNFLAVEAIVQNPSLLPPYITWRERAEQLGWAVWAYEKPDGSKLFVLKSPKRLPYVDGKPVELSSGGVLGYVAKLRACKTEAEAWENLPRTMSGLLEETNVPPR